MRCRDSECVKHLLKFLELVDVRELGAQALLTANQSVSQQRIDNLKIALKLTTILARHTTAKSELICL